MFFKRILILTPIYMALCFIGTTIYALATNDIPPLLEMDVYSYKMLLSLSIFLKWIPSIIGSVFFIALAVFLDRDCGKVVTKFSSSQMNIFQKIMLLTCINVFIIFCCQEILQPLVNGSMVAKETQYEDYNWYVSRSQEYHEKDDVFTALYHIDTAINLNPTSLEALELKELYERAPAENVVETLSYFPEISPTIDDTVDSTSREVLSLLQKARVSFEEKDFFDAHYYAHVALELGGKNNPNSQELQMISLEAWNILDTWSGFETDEDMMIFDLKRQGYTSLIEGDALSAYYIYLDLDKKIPYDPDVMRYFEVSRKALLNEYFFIDETVNLAHFERAKNVSFSVNRSDDIFYKISIGGITNVRSAGNFLKYLRNYSCTVVDDTNTILYSFTVPYVKLIGQPVSSLNNETATLLNLESSDLVPRLLLTSVDRSTQGVVSAPEFTVGEISDVDSILTLLPMSLDDFDLILDASAGPRYINLASLFSFIPLADDYGFSQQVYNSYLLQRISLPFLLIAIFIFMAIQAWNFRLEQNAIFRYYWILIVPIITVVAEFLRVLVDYGMGLISLSLAKLDGIWPIPATIGVFLILIVLFSIRFLSLHTKPEKK